MILNVKLLPDGSGRACIHWLIEDGIGPIQMQGHPQLRQQMGQPVQVKGRIACNPKQNSVNPLKRGDETLMCMFSNEVRAATCPKCLATDEAKEMLGYYEGSHESVGVILDSMNEIHGAATAAS